MNFRSGYLESLAEGKNKDLNLQATKTAAEYFLEVAIQRKQQLNGMKIVKKD